MKLAKFWYENFPAAKRERLGYFHSSGRFNARVFYRTKSGKLDFTWCNFATLDKAYKFVLEDFHKTKGGQKIDFRAGHTWLGFAICGDPDDAGEYKLLAWALPPRVADGLGVKACNHSEKVRRTDRFDNSEMCLNIQLGVNRFDERDNPESDGLMTGAEFDAYIEAIREALTDGGNICEVDAQENLISIDGNAGGDLVRFAEILEELYARGCWLECDICVDEYGNCEQYETSLYAHLEELLFDRAKDF